MRKAGGVLTIIGGIIGIGMGAVIIGKWSAPLIDFAIVALIVGTVALIGGIYALRAWVWSFAFAGGIAVIGIGVVIIGPWFGVAEYLDIAAMWAPLTLFGILGTIFIALRKEEFE